MVEAAAEGLHGLAQSTRRRERTQDGSSIRTREAREGTRNCSAEVALPSFPWLGLTSQLECTAERLCPNHRSSALLPPPNRVAATHLGSPSSGPGSPSPTRLPSTNTHPPSPAHPFQTPPPLLSHSQSPSNPSSSVQVPVARGSQLLLDPILGWMWRGSGWRGRSGLGG